MKFIDLTGKKFGKLTVIKRVENICGRSAFLCRCDCGEKLIVKGFLLKKGITKSCGCLRRKVAKENLDIAHRANQKYKLKNFSLNKKIYMAWLNMKNRCCNKNSKNYKNYGGRGIKVCKEWLNDFESFYEWAINNGCEQGLSIDRINNNGDYTPSNCRWSDMKTQSRNRRTNHLLTINNETHCLIEWSEKLNTSVTTLKNKFC